MSHEKSVKNLKLMFSNQDISYLISQIMILSSSSSSSIRKIQCLKASGCHIRMNSSLFVSIEYNDNIVICMMNDCMKRFSSNNSHSNLVCFVHQKLSNSLHHLILKVSIAKDDNHHIHQISKYNEWEK
jgi:hypothetical protein